MPSAYSRDPRRLFNNALVSSCAREPQPVTYRNATLRDVCYHEMRINWHTGEIVCFADADDTMNNVPILQTSFFMQAEPRSQDEYVRETFEFLQRGHSMLEPQCKCRIARFAELGVTYTTGECLLPRTRERRSFSEIARELCVKELDEPMLKVLVELAGLVVTDDHFLHSPLCCIAPHITRVEDIVHAAKMLSPFPYQLTSDKFNVLLQKRTDLLLVSSLVFLRHDDSRVSDDIKAIWHSALEKDNSGSLERSLKAVGLQPTAMRPVFFVPRKRPAPPQKTSKWKSLTLKRPC